MYLKKMAFYNSALVHRENIKNLRFIHLQISTFFSFQLLITIFPLKSNNLTNMAFGIHFDVLLISNKN